jgi:hypothetical protein
MSEQVPTPSEPVAGEWRYDKYVETVERRVYHTEQGTRFYAATAADAALACLDLNTLTTALRAAEAELAALRKRA